MMRGIYKGSSGEPYTLAFYIIISLVSTAYSYYWDVRFDWGLLRTMEPGKKYLRSKILFPVWYYYYLMVTDLLFRLFWIVPLFTYPKIVNDA